MKNTSKFLAAIGLISIGSAADIPDANAQKMEKCYGIVKAGKNDCKAADGRHTCAGYAKEDGSYNEWILLPYGTCERILDASSVSEAELDQAESE